jgi:proteasome assembly chaperone (PAC2) family protein
MYSVGAILGGVPHTKEPTVSCSVGDSSLKAELGRYAVRFSNYEGPATFNNILVAAFARRGIEAVHMTGRAIYYPEFNIAIPHDPKAIYSLLRRLRRMLSISPDLSDLEKQSRELEEKLNFMVSQSPRLRDYVQELEGNFEELRYEEPIEGAPEEFVKGVEEFLQQRREEER